MNRILRLFVITSFLFLFFTQTLFAQERKEQVFFIDSGSDDIFFLDDISSPPVVSSVFATPFPAGFVSAFDYDSVYRRLVYSADMAGSPELGVLYTEDVATGSPDITILLTSADLASFAQTISVNGATDEIYFIESSPSPGDRIEKTDFKGTPPSATPYFDGSADSNFALINDVAADTRRSNAVFFSSDDSSGAGEPSRLYYFDGMTLSYISSGLTVNAANKIRFDPVTERLYTLDTSSQNVLIYDVAANGTLTEPAPNQITYAWTMPDIASINSFDFLYDATSGDLSNVVLGDTNTNSVPPGEDIILDNTNIELKNDGNRPTAISFDSKFVVDVAATSICSDAVFDTNGDLIAADVDGDGIPDCRDECPNDASNICMYLLYTQENSDLRAINQFVRHEVDTINGQFLGTLFPNISIGGFYDEKILEFVFDQEQRTVYYTSDITPTDNSLFAIELESNVRSVVASFPTPTDSNVNIRSLSFDSEEPSLYVLIEDMNNSKCFVKKVNPAGGNPTLDMVPTIFERDCTGSEDIFDIVVDQRHDAKNNLYNKRLYYSYSNLGTMTNGVFEVDLMDNASDITTHVDITEAEFNGTTSIFGQLALDFNNDNLYYYIKGSPDGEIRFSQLPAIAGETAPSNLFVGFASPSTGELQGLVEEVELYYHPHIVAGGRLYISDATFTSGDAVKFKDMQNGNDTNCTSTCLVDSDTILEADVDEITGLDFYLTCNLEAGCTATSSPDQCDDSRSVDSNNDSFPDCSGFVDLCLADDSLTSDGDDDTDGTLNCNDECPTDPDKIIDDFCGCFNDFTCDVQNIADQCPENPARQFPGVCGCENRLNDDADTDKDGFIDCIDACPEDQITDDSGEFINIFPTCGCGVEEDISDSDGDGTPGCLEDCTDSIDEGCGCGITDCTGIDGVRLTPTTRIKDLPGINNNRAGNRKPRKRRFRLSLKKFSGAVLNNSLNSEFSLGERRKRNRKLKVRYRVIVSKLVGDKIRRVKRIVTKKALTRLIRLKNGKYTVKYKALIKRKKKTVSKTNFSPSRSFNIPLS